MIVDDDGDDIDMFEEAIRASIQPSTVFKLKVDLLP